MTRPVRPETVRALRHITTERPPDGSVSGYPLWLVPWTLVRDATVVLPPGDGATDHRLFLSATVRPADWAAVTQRALADAGLLPGTPSP